MLTYILSLTVSKLLQIISHFFALTVGTLSLTHSFWVDLHTQGHEIWRQKASVNKLYRVVQNALMNVITVSCKLRRS